MKSVRQGYKMTELGEIPEEWKIVNLEEVINEFIVPMRDKPKVFDGDIPWCRIEDIEGNYLNGNKESRFVSEKTIKEMNLKVFPQGTLIASCSATLGVYAINTTPLITNQTFIGLVPSEKINVNYLLYYMNTTTDRLKNIASGTTIPYISRQKFEKFKIVLPNIEEQEKIASILSTVDEQIDNIDALIEKNKELKKGLMQTLLTKGVGHTKFKKTEVGEIPEEWEVKKVGDICEVKGGKRLPKGYQLEDEDNAFPYIRVADMYMGGIRQDDIKYVPKDIVDKIKNYKISKDDLFISVAGTLGIVGQVPYELDGANLTENADKLCNIQINKLYLMKVLQSNIIQSIIEAEQTKSAQPKLALTRIKEFLIPVPSDTEQVKIASILVEVDEKIEKYQNKKQKLEELKKGLMQKLLTGEIRVC